MRERELKQLATVKAALERAVRRDEVHVTVMTQELYGAFSVLEAATQPPQELEGRLRLALQEAITKGMNDLPLGYLMRADVRKLLEKVFDAALALTRGEAGK